MSITFETSDGTRLNVDTAGEGMPVVFLHGLCGDAGQTSEAFPTEPGYRRVTIEARGHGRSQSGGLDRLSIETFANDVAAYVEANLDVPVIIGGISMGAAISLRLAVKRPDLVRALVLARPAWLTASAPENMIPNAEVGHLLTHLPPPAAKAAFLAGPSGSVLRRPRRTIWPRSPAFSRGNPSRSRPRSSPPFPRTARESRRPISPASPSRRSSSAMNAISFIPSPTRVRWRRKSPLHASSRSPPRRRTRRDTSPISTAPCARS